jgi:hypothetical protein
MGQFLTSFYLSNGIGVLERAQLQRLFDEQHIILRHSSDDTADVLRVGRLAGAGYVVFGEANIGPPRIGYSTEGYQVSITVREVSVDTSQVIWSGSASFEERVTSSDQGVVSGTDWAIRAALCPVEDGSTWHPPPTGCKKKR